MRDGASRRGLRTITILLSVVVGVMTVILCCILLFLNRCRSTQIYFGKQYGLRITSEPDVGTPVEIRMPKIKEVPPPGPSRTWTCRTPFFSWGSTPMS